jgi:hydrogenase maturation protease
MNRPRILVACVGNIFHGDDGFGVEVARRLAGRALPAGALVKDFGIRSFDLAIALLEACELTILVDACPRGGEAGTVYLLEPDLSKAKPAGGDTTTSAPVDMHSMNPMSALRIVASMGGAPGRILVVGCEPAELGSDEEGKLGLSAAVQQAVDEAVDLIETVVSKALDGQPVETSV